jgi:chromatin segregation and condensation protein Rec8/ScpA/Scc1 (kleisin family)
MTETERTLLLFPFFLSPIHEQTEVEGAKTKRQGTIEKITKKRNEKGAGEIFKKKPQENRARLSRSRRGNNCKKKQSRWNRQQNNESLPPLK